MLTCLSTPFDPLSWSCLPQVWAATWSNLQRKGLPGGCSLSPRTATALGRALLSWCGVTPGALDADWSPALLDLLARMLDPCPLTRISMADVHRHDWIARVGCEDAEGAAAGLVEEEEEEQEREVEAACGGAEGGRGRCEGSCSPRAVSVPDGCLGVGCPR